MKRFSSRASGLLLLLALLILTASQSLAATKSVDVLRRDGDVTITPQGDMRFVETWQVQFIGGSFTFAYRGIEQGRFDSISDWGVSEGGRAYVQSSSGAANTYELYTENNQEFIKWHFSPTSNQTRTFTVQYTVHGGVRIYPGGDQFDWNFIESDRQYSIRASTVTLHLPANFAEQLNQLKATTYRNGAENSSAARVADGQTIIFSGANFDSGDQWELRAQFPHSAISAAAPAWQVAEDQRAQMQPVFSFVALAFSLIALVGGLLGLYLLWFTRGRDQAQGVVAEFYTSPPDDAPPGVAGTLVDESADMQDIIATIVDLARRGVIRMTERDQPGFFGHRHVARFYL